MADDVEALYLGGHPQYAASEPVAGQLRFGDIALEFMVMGEFYDRLFALQWGEVIAWDVEGPNTARRRSTGGRAAVGALLAGVPGAIIGMASTKEEFEAVLAIETNQATIAFLIRNRPPASVASLLRRVPELGDRQGQAPAQPVVESWEYRVATIDELEICGKEGWEAVGVWTDATSTPHVLLKRTRSH
jgi:hypothetical protein